MASNSSPVPEELIRKIGALPGPRIAEVEDFVDFISRREATGTRDRGLRAATRNASATTLAKVWSNPEDDVYDAL